MKHHLVNVGVIDERGNCLISNETDLNKLIPGSRSIKNETIATEKYLRELLQFIEYGKVIIAQITSDHFLLKKYGSKKNLEGRILKDIIYITKVVNELNQHTKLVELACCFVLDGFGLYRFTSVYHLKPDVITEQRISTDKIIEDYNNLIVQTNKITEVDSTKSGKIILPIFLGKLKHDFFEELAVLFFKYSNLLAYVDNNLSIPEEKLLLELYQEILR